MPSSVVMTSPPGGPRPGLIGRFFGTLELIKFSHTVFALPFALSAMLVAAQGVPGLWTLLWILWCLVSARTAAMAFNRWADWDYDTFNPRTRRRSQLGTRRMTMVLCGVALFAFVFGCSQLNFLCLALCPVACVLILGYSLTKRFTAYSHAFLGLALAAAPMGAWAATTGSLDSPLPWLLAGAVWCWVFGFDLIYAPWRGGGVAISPAAPSLYVATTSGFRLACSSWDAILGGDGTDFLCAYFRAHSLPVRRPRPDQCRLFSDERAGGADSRDWSRAEHLFRV